jgi:signal transduction histidine kinase/CheY-like chemotaxis protein
MMLKQETLRETLIELERARSKERELRIEYETLINGLGIVNSTQSKDEMFTRLLDVLQGMIAFDDAFILREDQDQLRTIASTSSLFEGSAWRPDKAFRRALDGQIVMLFDTGGAVEWQAQSAEIRERVVSALHAPMSTPRTRALLVCVSRQRAFFNPHHASLLRRFSPLVSQALHNLEINEQLNEAKELAETAAKAKSQFLANMSHEIRTPMNAVIGFTGLVLQSGLSELQRDYLQKIDTSAKSLLAIINDILDLSKIEAGKLTLERIDFRLHDLLEQVSGMFTTQASEKKLALILTVAPDCPKVLLGDPLRLGQVLINLTSNALKFTQEGEVEISVAPVQQDKELVRLMFAVRDTGIGIESDRLASLFESFTQADGSTTRRFGGTGLGLSICRKLVGIMGGEISVQSEPGQGTTFSFAADFSVQPSPQEPSAVPALEPQRSLFGRAPAEVDSIQADALQGMRVLLVEDDLVNEEVAIAILGRAGVLVEVARDGEEAMQRVRQKRYDCVLMDIQMPRLDGYEATAAIRRTPGLTTLPIIAMTAHAIQGVRERVLEAGMNDYITKPVEPATLFAKLAAWTSGGDRRHPISGARRAKSPEGDAPVRAKDEIPGINLEDALDRLDNEMGLLLEALGAFVTAHSNASERLRQALAEGDINRAGLVAHTIKGAAASISAGALGRISNEIEEMLKNGETTNLEPRLFAFDEELQVVLQSISSLFEH